MNSNIMKIGLVGFSQGSYAVNYTRYLSTLKKVEIAGICDLGCSDKYALECAFITPLDFSKELDAPLVHTLEDLFSLEPHGIIVTNETIDHCRIAANALQKDIHVFVAKPLTFILSQAVSIKKMASDSVLLCGNPLKYEQGIVEIKELLEQKKLGNIISIRIMINHQAMIHQEWERDPGRSGGPLGTYGIYLIDLVRWLCSSDMKTIFAFGDNYMYSQIGSYDAISAVAKLDNNIMCNLQLISTIEYKYPFVCLEIVGTDGTVTTNYDNYSYLFSSTKSVETGSLRYSDMGNAEISHFLECIRGNSVERCNIDDMVHVANGIEAIDKSIKTGLPVDLEVINM